jgi:hypothetical protein
VEIAPEDLLRIQNAARDLAVVARLLDVSDQRANWMASKDATEGVIAADALDQARGLLEELVGGELSATLLAVERVARALPPPIE